MFTKRRRISRVARAHFRNEQRIHGQSSMPNFDDFSTVYVIITLICGFLLGFLWPVQPTQPPASPNPATRKPAAGILSRESR